MSDELPLERRADYPILLRLVTRIDERTEMLVKSFDRMEQTLYVGNGEPSVLARLATLEERTPRKREPAIWGAAGTFIGGLVVAIAAALGLKPPVP